MQKYTLADFRADYPNEDACLDQIYKLRFTNLVCPKCENDKPFNRVKIDVPTNVLVVAFSFIQLKEQYLKKQQLLYFIGLKLFFFKLLPEME